MDDQVYVTSLLHKEFDSAKKDVLGIIKDHKIDLLPLNNE